MDGASIMDMKDVGWPEDAGQKSATATSAQVWQETLPDTQTSSQLDKGFVPNDGGMLLPAILRSTIFESPDADFAIYACSLNPDSTYFSPDAYPPSWRASGELVVKGKKVPQGGKGSRAQSLVFVGTVTPHAKYGLQFKAANYFVDEPAGNDGMRGYLDTLPNIGPQRARILLKKFTPDQVKDMIENRPEELIALKIGLTESRVAELREKWRKDRVSRGIYMWLSSHGISFTIAEKIIDKWGGDAIQVLEADPYELTAIRGIGFRTADKIAHTLFKDIPVNKRVVACLRYILGEDAPGDGHLCLPAQALFPAAMAEMFSDSPASPADEATYTEAMQAAVKDPFGMFCAVKVPDGNTLVYERLTWKKEDKIAKFLHSMSTGKATWECPDSDLAKAEEDLHIFHGKEIRLDAMQKEAVRSSFTHKLTVITGGGGTGKSTICRCICSIAKSRGMLVAQMAPTGKAAKVLNVKTSHEAMTIHRALKFMPGEEEKANTIAADIVIVDESSMCGLDTFLALSIGIPDNANLVMVGDPQQLPSVSPGNFLFDLIRSGSANVVKLDRIYRQDENSYITVVADAVAKGEKAVIPPTAKDIKWIDATSVGSLPSCICGMMRKFMEAGNQPDELQVMAPMKKGENGVYSINAALQDAVAKQRGHTKPLVLDRCKFYEGDKVMQFVNNYEKDVYNGDVGVVTSCGKKVLAVDRTDIPESYVVVDYGDRPPVTYSGPDLDQIQPAWCVTVHKYQGSQCPNVIFVLVSDHYVMANRELFYTAITRAEKKVVIIGDQEMLRMAPTRSAIKKRNTCLAEMMMSMSGRGGKILHFNCPNVEDSFAF